MYLRLNQFGNFCFGTVYLVMRCSKSCYLCDLELADLFDVVDQVVFFRNDFLVDRTADFCFHVAGCSAAFSPANECTYIYFKYCRSLRQCAAFFCIFDCRNLKSLSYAMWMSYRIFSYISRQVAIINQKLIFFLQLLYLFPRTLFASK